jgi:hypothetical protein
LPLDKADENACNRFAHCSIGDPPNSISAGLLRWPFDLPPRKNSPGHLQMGLPKDACALPFSPHRPDLRLADRAACGWSYLDWDRRHDDGRGTAWYGTPKKFVASNFAARSRNNVSARIGFPQALSPLRLSVATRGNAVRDAELRQLVEQDLQIILASKPNLRPAVIAAYATAL